MPLLNPGDPFPRLTITTTDGQALTIPDVFAGDFGVVLFYRGAWCPYCNAQLRAFERASQALADAGIRVAALSVDDEETTATLVAKHKLTFPSATARRAGRRRAHRRLRQPGPGLPAIHRLRARPAGNVVVSVYSSGAIGRLVPDDVIGLVRYLREHSPSATA